MSIFKVTPTAELLDERAAGTMVEFLGIETHKIGEDFITMKMPVDHRTIQPLGLLHGGASAVLAESVGSLAANLCVDPKQQFCVGLDINANHIRAVREGWVFGTAARCTWAAPHRCGKLTSATKKAT